MKKIFFGKFLVFSFFVLFSFFLGSSKVEAAWCLTLGVGNSCSESLFSCLPGQSTYTTKETCEEHEGVWCLTPNQGCEQKRDSSCDNSQTEFSSKVACDTAFSGASGGSSGGTSTATCQGAHPDWSCQNKNVCGITTPAQQCTGEKIAQNSCEINLCNGGADIICCQTKWCLTLDNNCFEGTAQPCPGEMFGTQNECQTTAQSRSNGSNPNVWCYDGTSCTESQTPCPAEEVEETSCDLCKGIAIADGNPGASCVADNTGPTVNKWCLTPEKNCIEGPGAACAGTTHDTQQACITALNQQSGNTTSSSSGVSDSIDCPPGTPEGSVCLVNPIGTTDITQIFGNLIKVATGLMGSLALLVFIYGGFIWLTSAGNADKIKQGTNAMVWAVIGIVVIFASYAIINLVLSGLGVN